MAVGRGVVRPHKYRAQPTVVDGIRFASKAEAAYYCRLKLLVKVGEIRDLELQPKFPLYAIGRNGIAIQIGTYRADFRFREGPDGILRIDDVKGFDVPLQKWKRKHAEAQYGIEVRVIR